MDDDYRRFIEEEMRQDFERSLSEKVDRSIRVPKQQLAPSHYFASPTVECRRMFVEGHFFGCISLVQAVAEAIARFLLEKHPEIDVQDSGDHLAVVNALQRDRTTPVITARAFAAFRTIRGPRKGHHDRNAYHHLTDEIELERTRLERRAEQCLSALHEIESEVFAYDIRDGPLFLKHPEYWPVNKELSSVRVMMR